MAKRTFPASRLIFGPKEIGLPGVISLGRFQHAKSVPAIAAHVHRGAMEICFLERGVQTFRVKGKLYRMHGNDQFFTLPDEIHDTANLPEERGILYWLILKPEPKGSFLGLAPQPAKQLRRELLRMPARHFRAHPDCAAIFRELVDRLKETRAGRSPSRQPRIQALFLDYLTLTIASSRLGLQGSASPLIQRVLRYVEHHLCDPVHVPRLAEIARLSVSRFKSRFKREMGVPPAEYWLRQKIEKASSLLGQQTVTQVAFELGFSSSQYFATAFKRYTLINPSRFQNQHKNII